jgi:hypothetical protein
MKIIIGLTLLAITFAANPFFEALTPATTPDVTVATYCTRVLTTVNHTIKVGTAFLHINFDGAPKEAVEEDAETETATDEEAATRLL